MDVEQPERIGTLGWQSFLASKDEMLYQYRAAKKYSKSHTVQTFHGKVAEAVFRKWLAKFLPKRYAVTSGYVISQNAKDSEKMPHFDVIIYDQIEAPVLWHEGNPDSSEMGVSKAIPAEYVVSILEVKSSFDPQTVKKAVAKLKEIEHLLVSVDDPAEPYKKYIPKIFCCGLIFFELKKINAMKKRSMEIVIEGASIRNYLGALILEGEGQDSGKTARIKLYESQTIFPTTVGDGKEDLFGSPLCGKSNKESNGSYLGALLTWGETEFANYIFDMIAIWNETYRPGYIPSLHGMSYMNPERKNN